MIKIAIFCDTTKTGGILQHCKLLKTLLEETGEYKVTLYSELDYRNISEFRIYSRRQIKEALISDDYDYIHLHGFISCLPRQVYRYAKKINKNAKVILTPHAHPFNTLNHPRLNKIFFYIYAKKIYGKVNKIVSINKEDKKFFVKFNKNVITIPHWCNGEFYNKKQNLNQKQKLLFVGRNDANKNLQMLYNIPEGKYEVICVTNTPPLRKDFIYKTRLSEEQLNKLYEEVDLTIIPSRYEAFSYVALESLRVGTPILISDRVRIADFLDDSCMTVYKYNSISAFLNGIEITKNKRVDTEKIEQVFSKTKAISTYMNLFN